VVDDKKRKHITFLSERAARFRCTGTSEEARVIIHHTNAKLSQAVEAVEKLPADRQDRLADDLLEATTREMIDGKIAAGEASYAQKGSQ